MHARLSNLFSAFYFCNMKPIIMLIFGWGCKGWSKCIPTDLFKCVVKFVNNPPNHLPQFFSSLHFVRFLGFNSNLFLYHLLATCTTLPPWQHQVISLGDPFFFPNGFDHFFCFPSTASSSFDASSPFAMEVDLQCFESYLTSGFNPWSVLNEHTYLMIVLVINFWSCSLLIFAWLLIKKWEVDFSSTNMCSSFLVSWANLKLGYTDKLNMFTWVWIKGVLLQPLY